MRTRWRRLTKLPNGIRRFDLMFIPVPTVTESIEKITGIPMDAIRSNKRMQPICDARHLVNYFLTINTELSLEQIALVTNKGHVTIMHSRDQIENWMETDSETMQIVIDIANVIINKSIPMEKTERSTAL